MMTPAQIERNLKRTGGKTVVKGAETTYGHLGKVPMEAAVGESGAGRVLTSNRSVLIAAGTLTGITDKSGIGDSLTVDGLNYVIIAIAVPDNDADGDLLELVLRRA